MPPPNPLKVFWTHGSFFAAKLVASPSTSTPEGFQHQTKHIKGQLKIPNVLEDFFSEFKAKIQLVKTMFSNILKLILSIPILSLWRFGQ